MAFIGSSSSLGQPLPPRFQHVFRAKADDSRVNEDVFRHMRKVRASFGNLDSDGQCCHKNWPITTGANVKGGMDRDEFKKCVQTNILKLHPDAANGVPGKRVVVEVNGGPGRLNSQTISMLCVQGFCLHSCVPNSTAVTQETDENCGLFKSVCGRNARKLTKD